MEGIPGRQREVEGWDSFVHVARTRWWTALLALLAVALPVAIAVAPFPVTPVDCQPPAWMGEPPVCRGGDPPVWVQVVKVAGPGLGALAGLPLMMPGMTWLALRTGSVRWTPCARCSQEHGPLAPSCTSRPMRMSEVDGKVMQARFRHAWRCVPWRARAGAAFVVASGLLLLVLAAFFQGERVWTCTPQDAHGVSECAYRDDGPAWASAAAAWGALLFGGGIAVTCVWLLVRVVRPLELPAARDHEGFAAPPGGW